MLHPKTSLLQNLSRFSGIINLKSRVLRKFIEGGKILNFVFIALSLSSSLLAGPPDTLWTKEYKGGNYISSASSAQQMGDSGIIVCGGADQDIYVIRTDYMGDTLWTRKYGGDSTDYEGALDQTDDGGFIIVGYTESYGAGNRDIYLLRLNSNGDSLWTKTYGGADFEEGKYVQQTFDGGFIVVGYTTSFGAGYQDIYLLLLNSSGDTLWTKTYGGPYSDMGMEVQQTHDSGFIIIGYTENLALSSLYLLRVNSKGDTLWTKKYGYDSEGHSVQQTSDSGFIIAGGQCPGGSNSDLDFFLVRTDQNGDTLWTKNYNTVYDNINLDNMASCIRQTADGGFIMVGNSFGQYPASLVNTQIIRTDPDGDSLWMKIFGTYSGNSPPVAGISVRQTFDGGYIVAGSRESKIYYVNVVYLIRLDKETTAIQTTPNPLNQNNFLVSCNNNLISIRYTLPFSTRIKIEAFNIQGRLIEKIQDRFMHKGSYSVKWNIKKFGSGIYYLKLKTGKKSYTRKVFVMK